MFKHEIQIPFLTKYADNMFGCHIQWTFQNCFPYATRASVSGVIMKRLLYQKVYQHLSLILDKVDWLDFDTKTLCVMTNTYREKARTFPGY